MKTNAFFQFPGNHGRFPYIIAKTAYAVFFQFPVIYPHAEKITTNCTGVFYMGKEIFEDYLQEDFSINLAAQNLLLKFRDELNRQHNKKFRLCLVLDRDDCFYLETYTNRIIRSKSIPTGGTLLNCKGDIIAMNRDHYSYQYLRKN